MDGVTVQTELTEVGEVGRASERRRPGLLVLAGAVLYSWIAAGFTSFTAASAMAVGVPGVAGVLLASSRWPDERARPVHRLPRTALAWAVWFVVTCLWEAYAFFHGSTPAHPTLSVLLDGPLEVRAIRTIAFLGWLGLGWKVLRR